jgi:primosomal protein N' (replication factor Y)
MGRPDRQQALFANEDLPEVRTPWEIVDQADQLYAEIVFNLPLPKSYHYLVPVGLREQIQPGSRVRVPFGAGSKPTGGYCVSLSREKPANKNFKSIESLLDTAPLADSAMLRLTRWISQEYLCSWGQVLDSVIPAGVKSKAGTRELLHFALSPNFAEKLGRLKLPPAQKRIVDILQSAPQPMAADELTTLAECGLAPVQGLRGKGLIVATKVRTWSSTASSQGTADTSEIILNADQRTAVERTIQSMTASRHETFLLYGVTGSGKTEVYIRVIEEVVKYGRQAIVLVPEISLTPQTIRRFRARFSSVAVLHSHLTDVERHSYWQQIARGDVQVVVGARSAVFAPTPNLGLIVIDEEHETSFKQDSIPRYHTREVARRRALDASVPLILGSATPTLETWLRGIRKQDVILSLPTRVARRPLPPVVTVDTRDDISLQKGASLGRAMLVAMREALARKGQIILFLNVRGFSPALFCRACGQSVRCPDCDVTLTYHKQRQIALCHSCDYSIPPPTHCPNCHKPRLLFLGQGTERLEHEVKAKFPGMSVLRMDSDTMQQRGSHDEALEAFREGHVRILLGTQMIAKGLDFPNVTLVGVIDADTSLHQPDFRASERTFQLIAQVAGRTGRGELGGKVLVQTACPDQPAIQCAARHDYTSFAKQELEHRHALGFPPFVRLMRIIFRGEIEADVEKAAQRVRVALEANGLERDGATAKLLGPAPCAVAKLKKYFRYQLQISHPQGSALGELWRKTEAIAAEIAPVELTVDVDPMNFR